MKSETVNAVAALLAEERPVVAEQVPAELDGVYSEELVLPPSTCRVEGCESEARVKEAGDEFLVRCYANSSHGEAVPKEDRIRYRPDFEAILAAVADELGLEVSEYSGDELPRFALAHTAENIDVALLYGPNDYAATVKDILQRTIEQSRPCLLLTPRDEVSDVVELQSVYGVGYLAYAVPFNRVAEMAQIRETLETIVELHELNQQAIAERFGEDPNEFTIKANRNPSYILSELSRSRSSGPIARFVEEMEAD